VLFKTKSAFPKKLSKEYLVVDLLNNLKELAEDPEKLATTFLSRLKDFNSKKLMVATQLYGSGFTKRVIKTDLRKSLTTKDYLPRILGRIKENVFIALVGG
jgi:hypothetical protein